MDFYVKKRKAFQLGTTLLELLIAVIIIGIVSTVAVPGYNRMIETRRDVEAQDALTAIFEAERLYLLRNQEYTANWGDLMMPDPGAGGDWAYTIT